MVVQMKCDKETIKKEVFENTSARPCRYCHGTGIIEKPIRHICFDCDGLGMELFAINPTPMYGIFDKYTGKFIMVFQTKEIAEGFIAISDDLNTEKYEIRKAMVKSEYEE